MIKFLLMIIGWLLILSPLVVITIAMILCEGWKFALIVWGFILLLIFAPVCGGILLSKLTS